MDKYEFNIKLEQIKKLRDRKDYETCAKIADTIEWRKVKQWQVLKMAAECYEAAGKYEEARDLRILGYNRNMGGKNNVYKMVELYVKTGDFDEAMDLYNEYIENWPKDIERYTLLYTIKYAKDAPYTELIDILEKYLAEDLDEKIMYELCELYEKTGQIDKCIRECDELFMWFGEGVFVDAALEMKKAHATLTPRQQEAYDTLQLTIESAPDTLYDEDLDDDETEDEDKNNFFDFDETEVKEDKKEEVEAKRQIANIGIVHPKPTNEQIIENSDSIINETIENIASVSNSNSAEQSEVDVDMIQSMMNTEENTSEKDIKEPLIKSTTIRLPDPEEIRQYAAEQQRKKMEEQESEEKEFIGIIHREEGEFAFVNDEDERSLNGFEENGSFNENEAVKENRGINEDNGFNESDGIKENDDLRENNDFKECDVFRERRYDNLREFMDNEELSVQIINLLKQIDEAVASGRGLSHMNIIIAGNGSVNRQELVLALVKSIFESDGTMTRKIARINGDALNKKGIMKVKDKLSGTILIIESAGSANMARVDELTQVMTELDNPPFVVLEDSAERIDILLRRNPLIQDYFGGRIELMEYSVNDMVSMAKSFAHQKGYGINDKALLQLYLIIDTMHSKAGGIDESSVENIIDKAIANSDRKGVNKVRKKLPRALNGKGVIMLTESDFR